MTDQDQNSTNHVAAVSPKIPPFWSINPDIWFAQVEATFVISGITADKTKFCHVIANIESKHLEAVQDILKDPPADDKYATLKERLLKEFSLTETEKLNKILQTAELGDKKPTQLLREMQSLAGSNLGASAIETLFLQRLPDHVKHILSASSSTLKEKAEMADKILDYSNPHISSLNAVSKTTSEIDDLKSEVKRLTETVNKLMISQPNKRQGRSRSPYPRYQRSTSPRNLQVCFYHNKYGEKAHKCVSPCNYKKEN